MVLCMIMKSLPATLFIWFKVSRPIAYPLLPILFVLGLQAGGLPISEFQISHWLFIISLTWPLSMIIYGINDLYDQETDQLDHTRLQYTDATTLAASPRILQQGIKLAILIFAIQSLLLFGWWGIGLTVLVCLASCFYSVPPIRIKERPILDIIFSGAVYGFLLYQLGYSIAAASMNISYDALLIGGIASLFHLLGAIRDCDHDARVGHTTTAVYFGRQKSKYFAVILFTVITIVWYMYRGLAIEEMVFFASLFLTVLLLTSEPSQRYIRFLQVSFLLQLTAIGFFKVLF